jgi:hypothetical protein
MSQWKSDDSAANTPNWTPATVNLPSNTGNQTALFGNSTADAFVTGQTIGVYGVDSAEVQYGSYTLSGVSVGSSRGSGVVLTSNSTTGFTVNGGTSSVAAVINVDTLAISTAAINAAGEGYSTGDVVSLDDGEGTAATLTVTANATGNVTAVSILAPGVYANGADLPGDGSATSNVTGDGTGLVIDATVGVGTVSVSNTGLFTAIPAADDNAVTEQAGQSNTDTALNLVFSKVHTSDGQGYVKVTTGSGGRAGRRTTEVLVASKSMTGDAEDTVFPNTA